MERKTTRAVHPGTFTSTQNRHNPASRLLNCDGFGSAGTVLPGAKYNLSPTTNTVDWANWITRHPATARHHNRATPSVTGSA